MFIDRISSLAKPKNKEQEHAGDTAMYASPHAHYASKTSLSQNLKGSHAAECCKTHCNMLTLGCITCSAKGFHGCEAFMGSILFVVYTMHQISCRSLSETWHQASLGRQCKITPTNCSPVTVADSLQEPRFKTRSRSSTACSICWTRTGIHTWWASSESLEVEPPVKENPNTLQSNCRI